MTQTAFILSAALLTACLGGGQQQRSTLDDDEVEEFKCNGRQANYVVLGGFVAHELGIAISCEPTMAKLVKWTATADGERDESEHIIGRASFDEIWQDFEDAGWRNLADCLNAKADENDEVYSFTVADSDSNVTMVCQGKANNLPFPFDRLVNTLDAAAGEF